MTWRTPAPETEIGAVNSGLPQVTMDHTQSPGQVADDLGTYSGHGEAIVVDFLVFF